MAEREQARLKARYEREIRPALLERFHYSSPMQAPAIQKITLNMGVGDGKQDSKVIDAATDQLAAIAGQRPNVRRARKSIANFKLREGMPVGVSVTLRGERGYEFLDRLMSVAIPRIRDFRGLSPRAFDGRGNYSMGVREQIIFPEIDYDAVDQVRGLDITITTSARTDAEAFALLEAFGFPFSQEGRPTLPGSPSADAETEVEAQAASNGSPASDPAPAPTEPSEPSASAQAPTEAPHDVADEPDALDSTDAATTLPSDPEEDPVSEQSSETASDASDLEEDLTSEETSEVTSDDSEDAVHG